MSEEEKPGKKADKVTGVPWDTEEEQKRDRERQETARAKMYSKSAAELLNRPLRTAQEYLDIVALYQSEHATPRKFGKDATEEEKAADRERRLAAPTTKHRKIFSTWPRDPNGPVIRPENSKLGKMAANRVQFWGATLFDFFYVRRIPDCPYLATISTGSKLSEWMKEQGEYYAKDQMARAEREPVPQVVQPYPVDWLLRDLDAMSPLERSKKGKGKQGELQFGRELPFSKTRPTPILQDRIPLHLLPKSLIVHDPFKTLSTVRSRSHPPNWDDKPDAVSTHRLQFSDEGKRKMELELEAAAVAGMFMKTTHDAFLQNPTAEGRALERGLLFIPQGTKPGPCPPAVYFMHEPRPVRHSVPEAHLYLTPHELTGTGNHSVVYNVEWELPRHVLVEDIVCKKCVFQKGMAMLEAEDGPNGEAKDPKWLQHTGKVVETVKEYPGFSLCPFDEEGDNILGFDGEVASYDIDPPSRVVTRKYHGPVRVINTGVRWQNADLGEFCEHLKAEREGECSTVRVKVVAKMSLDGDLHLEREAKNYQEFPKHFFEHWSGYNILPPLHDPVPIGALVPQFYGYYVPDESVPVRVWERKARKGGGKGRKAEGAKRAEGEDKKDVEGEPVKDTEGDGAEEGADAEKFSDGGGDKDKATELAPGAAANDARKEVGDVAQGLSTGLAAEKKGPSSVGLSDEGSIAKEGEGERDAIVNDETKDIAEDAGKGEEGAELEITAESAEADAGQLDHDSSAESVLDEYDSGADEGLTPEELERQKNVAGYYTYRSPLLLIESCGESICDILETMTADDRQHCASMFFRMHHEGWVHQSAYTRNVIYQPGPLSESPLVRQKNATKRPDLRQTSFRLIDFGRSLKYDGASVRAGEEMDVTKTFRILHMS